MLITIVTSLSWSNCMIMWWWSKSVSYFKVHHIKTGFLPFKAQALSQFVKFTKCEAIFLKEPWLSSFLASLVLNKVGRVFCLQFSTKAFFIIASHFLNYHYKVLMPEQSIIFFQPKFRELSLVIRFSPSILLDDGLVQTKWTRGTDADFVFSVQ